MAEMTPLQVLDAVDEALDECYVTMAGRWYLLPLRVKAEMAKLRAEIEAEETR